MIHMDCLFNSSHEHPLYADRIKCAYKKKVLVGELIAFTGSCDRFAIIGRIYRVHQCVVIVLPPGDQCSFTCTNV